MVTIMVMISCSEEMQALRFCLLMAFFWASLFFSGNFETSISAQVDSGGSAPSETSGENGPAPSNETYYQKLLRKARTGSVAERAAAMKRLGRIGFPSALPVLRTNLDGSEKRLHPVALEAASRVEHPEALRLLVKQLLSMDPIRSSKAALHLVNRFPEKSIPELLKALEQDSKVVRRAAFTALEHRTGFRFGFEPDESPEARERAINSWKAWWRRNRDQSPETWWLRSLEPGNGPVALTRPRVISSIERLVRIRSKKAVPKLIGLLKDSAESVRVRAVRGLRTLTLREMGYNPFSSQDQRKEKVEAWQRWWKRNNSRSRFTWLINRLRTDAAEQTRVMKELFRETKPRHVSRLLQLLKSDQKRVVRVSLRLLRSVTGLTFGAPSKTEKGREESIRRWRAWGKRRDGDSKADWMMETLRNGKQDENRKAAAMYLKQVRTKRAVSVLIGAGLTDRSKAVREEAAFSLMLLTGRRHGFRPGDPDEKRAEAVQRWEDWWRRKSEKFFMRGPAVQGN